MTASFVSVALLSILAIAFAKSTGAIVALAAVAPVFVASMWRARGGRKEEASRRRMSAWPAAIVVAWIALSLFLTAWLPYQGERHWGPPLVQKLAFQTWSGSVRLSQYRETWALLRDHPIRGAGLAGYPQAIAPYHEDPRVEIFLYPHNVLLAVWVELGLAGLLVFLVMLYQFFRTVLTAYGLRLTAASIAAMLVLLIHGLVDVPYFKNDLALLFWVIIAIAVVLSDRLENRTQST